jgi:hypothetical protein
MEIDSGCCAIPRKSDPLEGARVEEMSFSLTLEEGK